MPTTLNETALERKVKDIYREAARDPGQQHHFEKGRALAERLGYPPGELDRVPGGAVESFAGVGYHLDLADLGRGDRVLDLGCGAGMDVFMAALRVGTEGRSVGLDMTDEQLAKAEQLREGAGFDQVAFEQGRIEELPFAENSFEAVISNGVINLSPVKKEVFEEIRRVLRPGGRLAISDIVSEAQMPESIKCDADLWASCIGGAMQVGSYTGLIEQVGFELLEVRKNDQYEFLSDQARGATEEYGVKSVSVGAQ